jgi:carbon-monoxide dehydrogenase large subunit
MLASEEARITLDSAGRVQVHMGTTSHGHSLETTMAQVVAEALGCDIDEVEITQGDTKGTPHGAGTGGSRSAVLGGGAAGLATGKLRSQVLDVAAALLDRRPDELAIEQGRVGAADGPGRTLGLRDIAAAVADRDPRIPPHIKPELAAAVRYTATAQVWSNSCHICTCEVDPRTGVVRILRYVVSEDCGNMINPMVVEGQIAGGVAQGIGGALYEHMVYDEYGNPLTSTFMDYLLPTAAEIPSFEYDHVITPSSTPGGYKGMGEGGAIGSPPAVMNAINDALAPFGIELTAQPATPSRILALLGGRARHDA